jgi:hypothetical protein
MMPRYLIAVLLASLALGVTVGCTSERPSSTPDGASPGGGGRAPAAETPEVGIRPLASPPAASSPGLQVVAAASPSPGTAETPVRLATADAARRTGAAVAEVTVERVEARTWPDRSLGCPVPGVGYAQVITPGFLIVVQARGQRLEYHTDQEQVIQCNA